MISSTTVLQNVRNASRNCLFVVVALVSFVLTPSIFAQDNTNQTSSGPRGKHVLDDVRHTVAQQLVSTLQEKGIKQLTVTKIYYNGSSINPVSAFIQHKVAKALLEAAQSGIIIMDRQDIELVAKENTLQWMIKGQADTDIKAGQAVLVGELLWQKPYSQALLSLRIVSTTTGQIITAPARIIDLDASLASHIGFATNDVPTTPMLSITPDSERQLSEFAKRLQATGGACSVTSVDSMDKRYQFAGRVLYCLACDQLVSNRVSVLERELLYQIAGEQAVAGKTLDSLLLGATVISFRADETTDASSPELTVRAVRRSDNALAALAEITMSSPKPTTISAGSGPAQFTSIGSEDELAATVRKQQEQASIARSDALVFTATFRLSDKMELDDSQVALIKRHPYPAFHAWHTYTYNEHQTFELSNFNNSTNEINGLQVFDAYLERLVSLENGNVAAIKASILSMAISGFSITMDPVGGTVFPGPLQFICWEIAERYTPRQDRVSDLDDWNKLFYGGSNVQPLALHLYNSMNPRLRTPASIDPAKGTVKGVPDDYNGYPCAYEYNYVIETEWKGKYPSTVKVTIDLTPMRDKLYKVKSTKE